MRKSLLVIGAVLLSALVVSADDDSPKYEAFAGYNFVRFNPASTAFIPSFNANGGNGQFVYNVWQNFGVVLDMGAVTKDTLNHLNIDSTDLNFVAGPRYTLHLR